MVLGDRTVGDTGGEAVPEFDTFALLENLCEAAMLREAAFVLLAAPDSTPLAERAALSVGGEDARCVIVGLPVATPPVEVPRCVALPRCEVVAEADSEGDGGEEAERKDEPVTEDVVVLLKKVLSVADVEKVAAESVLLVLPLALALPLPLSVAGCE